MRITEKILILPALYLIKRKGKVNTSELIEGLTIVFNPSGEDAKILTGRHDTKFSQKVRNLVSHRNSNGMTKYTNFKDGIYSLTGEGDLYVLSRLNELNYLFSQKFMYEDTISVAKKISEKGQEIIVYDENIIISEGKIEVKENKARERSKALRDAAILYYSQLGKLKCKVCGFCFEDMYGDIGKNFIEIHHERPICKYENSGNIQFISEAVKNVKPLCSNCHRMIHRK